MARGLAGVLALAVAAPGVISPDATRLHAAATPASRVPPVSAQPPDAGPPARAPSQARAGQEDEPRFAELRALLDQALVANGVADYARVIDVLDRALAGRPNDPVLHHYRGFALYRQASVLAATGGVTERGVSARALFEAADRALERASTGLDWPETLALRSAVTGQLISGGGPLAGVRLGPRSARQLDDALARGPENPRVWMLRGVAELYRPRLMGGSAAKAEASLRRAIALFATDAPAPPAPWWGHAESYGWLGQALAKQGKTAEARAAYARALEMQPGNAWVERFLLPALEREAPAAR